jgi:hypothetical protein
VNLRRTLILFAILASALTQADNTCRQAVVLLGSESASHGESPREKVIAEIAGLYGLAINSHVSMEVVQDLLQRLAEREGKTVEEIRREVEALETSPAEQRAAAEEKRERREQEQARFLEGLLPYLDRIGRDDRTVIEDTLLRPGFVNPLITGEVEFRFQGNFRSHGVAVSEISFKPGVDDFVIGQVPVTQLLFFLAALGERGVEATPSHFKEGEGAVVLRLGERVYSLKPNHPVEDVDFETAVAHAGRVSKLTGLLYGVPAESQWDVANRGGARSSYHFGNDVTQLPLYAWFDENSGGRTHAVGELFPNDFHLYDTHGNVWEWTTSNNQEDRVFRGGGWNSSAQYLCSSYRYSFDPRGRYSSLGFRLVRQSSGHASPAHIFTLGETAEPEVNPGKGSSISLRSLYQGLMNRMSLFRRNEK